MPLSLYIEYINQTLDLPPLIVLDILFKLPIRTISFNLAALAFDLFVGPGSIYSKDLISLKCTLQVLWNFDPSDVIYNLRSFKKFKGAEISMKPLPKLQTILTHNCKQLQLSTFANCSSLCIPHHCSRYIHNKKENKLNSSSHVGTPIPVPPSLLSQLWAISRRQATVFPDW